MTEAGCPMDQSAISKLESGKRGISVEELVAFALVFQTTVERMLSSPTPEDLGVEVMELLERLHTRRKTLVKASNGVGELLRELAVTVLDAGHFTPRSSTRS
jgi:transcriptional regulator with XRE-family HTH domain